MRCLKPFSVSLLCVLLPAAAFAAPETMTSCLEQGKKAYADKELSQAKDIFVRCVKINPSDEQAQLSLAGILLTLNDLDGAEKSFHAALKKMNRASPYIAYTYSMLGDIALKRRQNKEALVLYSKSLQVNPANVNSLVGKGVILEYQGDKLSAAEFYRSALAVEPLNLVARKRLVNLEPEYMTDAEILAALKQRYAVKPEVKELSDEHRALFTAIHRAEQRRGIDYLKNKYPKVPAEFIVTINRETDFEREMLTLAGYTALEKHIGQDAIAVFQRVGVPIQDVFALRNQQGEKVFKEDSTLTEAGFTVYTDALQNRKTFLLPNESLPPTPEFLSKLAAREKELKEAGYVEITYSELKMIENQTLCSEETLRSKLGVYVLPVNKNKRRYFVFARKPKDALKGVPYYYLMKAHSKRNPKIKVPANSLIDSYALYGYTVCLSDGNLLE